MKFYFGGRISQGGWRDSILGERAGGIDDIRKWPITNIPGTSHEYVGPYFISCDHGCAHGSSTHAALKNCGEAGERADVARLCLEAINKCDVFFAWLEPEAYGTLVELGYAKALGKKIVVAFAGDYYEPVNEHERSLAVGDGIRDMWFAIEQADIGFNSSAPKQAFEAAVRELEKSNVRESSKLLLFQNEPASRYVADRSPIKTVYIIRSGDDGPIKIGTTGDVKKRIAQLQTSSPHSLHLLATFRGDGVMEKRLHQRFHKCRLQGEWFESGPVLQWLSGTLA